MWIVMDKINHKIKHRFPCFHFLVQWEHRNNPCEHLETQVWGNAAGDQPWQEQKLQGEEKALQVSRSLHTLLLPKAHFSLGGCLKAKWSHASSHCLNHSMHTLLQRKTIFCNVYLMFSFQISKSSCYSGVFWQLPHPTLDHSSRGIICLFSSSPHPIFISTAYDCSCPKSSQSHSLLQKAFWIPSPPFLASLSWSFWLPAVSISSSQPKKEVTPHKVPWSLPGPGHTSRTYGENPAHLPVLWNTEYSPYGQDLQRILQLNS